MGIGYIEVPASDVPALPEQIFVNKTMGSLSCSASLKSSGTAVVVNFPRTMALFNGGNQQYPPTPYSSQVTGKVISASGFFQESAQSNPIPWMGRYDIVLLGGNYEGWDANGTYDRGLLVDCIQQICNTPGFVPTSCWQYFCYEDRITNGNTLNAPYESYFPTLDNEKWLLYGQPNQAGSPVADSFGNGNATNFCVAWPGTVAGVPVDELLSPGRTTATYDGNPEDLLQYSAAYATELFIARHTSFTGVVCGTIAASAYKDPRWYPNLVNGTLNDAMKAPNMAGIWIDNEYFYPRETGYWDLKNSYGSSSNSPVTPWYARGHRHFQDREIAIMAKCYPNLTYERVGNIGSAMFVLKANPTMYNEAANALSGSQDGGLIEAPAASSYEGSYGTAGMISGYQALMDLCTGPKKVVVAAYMSSLTDYQTGRYWLGISLMDDGYYNAQATNTSPYSNVWLDEFGGNPNTNVGKGWLGQPLSARPTGAAVNGCWIRDFTNGLVILNPKGNGSQTITNTQLNNYLGKSYNFSFLKGVQVPAINTGLSMTSVTIAARDAILLRH